jgi:hypothetical protein
MLTHLPSTDCPFPGLITANLAPPDIDAPPMRWHEGYGLRRCTSRNAEGTQTQSVLAGVLSILIA